VETRFSVSAESVQKQKGPSVLKVTQTNVASEVASGIGAATGWVQISLIEGNVGPRAECAKEVSLDETAREAVSGKHLPCLEKSLGADESEGNRDKDQRRRRPLAAAPDETVMTASINFHQAPDDDDSAALASHRAAQFDRTWSAVMELLMVEGQLGQRPRIQQC